MQYLGILIPKMFHFFLSKIQMQLGILHIYLPNLATLCCAHLCVSLHTQTPVSMRTNTCSYTKKTGTSRARGLRCVYTDTHKRTHACDTSPSSVAEHCCDPRASELSLQPQGLWLLPEAVPPTWNLQFLWPLLSPEVPMDFTALA